MDHFEKVEKLRERANVTYEEAKEALEASDWDILEAVIYLERMGKADAVAKVGYTGGENNSSQAEEERTSKSEGKESFGEVVGRFGRWCAKWIDKGNSNSFCIEKNQKEILRVPVTLLVVLLIFAFWAIVPLLIIGLFCEMRYHFQGPDIKKADLNKAMDTVADAAENFKSDIVD